MYGNLLDEKTLKSEIFHRESQKKEPQQKFIATTIS